MPDKHAEELADHVAKLLIQIYEIHDNIINETGGFPGLRDATVLHAAAARPYASFGGEELYPTDFEKAAALFHSLIKSHPFMDGTKRTAFSGAIYFIKKCGYPIPAQFPVNEVVEFCVSIAEETLHQVQDKNFTPRSISEIAKWFQELLGITKN